MSIEFTVEGKVIGQKRPLFTDWHIELPPIDKSQGDHLKLCDLIRSIVTNEVDAFKARQEQRKLAQVMSKQKIEQEAQKGRVDPGEKDFQQSVDVEDAVAVALQAFEDGLYYVFIDDVQQPRLDDEVFLKNNSRVVFLRLTALAGG